MPPSEDLVDALLERARQSAHAVSFAHSVFERRDDYQEALAAVRRIDEAGAHDQFVHAFTKAYEAARDELAHSEYRSDLLNRWMLLLIEAVQLVDPGAESPSHVRPFHELLDDEDLEIMEIDRRENSDLAAEGILEAWQA